MASHQQKRSKVAQLLYYRSTALEFRAVAEALLHVLERQTGNLASVEMSTRHAVFALPDLTVTLRYSGAITGPWQSAMTIWLDGAPEREDGSACATPHLGSLRGLLISTITAGNAPDRVIRHEMTGPATEEHLESLHDALVTAPSFDRRRDTAVVPMRPAMPQGTSRRSGDDDGPAAPGARVMITPANEEPDVNVASLRKAGELREALYTAEVDQGQPSKVLRLAAHTINASVMVIALPVGASLMVYSCLRGEDLTLSARTMAVTGMAVGLMQMAPSLPTFGF
ncbi:hypothetical protein [Pseudoroseicyclus tamaricis]|uniref:Uncharacterized protein n=2 Tax=Pseudoroseicyclus tamaricis TaxID=2705421 RepID=A0A6B2JRE7_9RHOB|nr:hypothetical protein [Pseudoroseicyclus tamaricis]NDV01147.1 hypothetical protein [Pseudoroseicyclus tamaricis]